MITSNSQATDRSHRAAARCWDVLVVGAGPAGSLAARQLARGGRTVLLVEKAVFPRYKVCGCCLNATAAAVLDRIGLGHVLCDLSARPIDRLALAFGGRVASLRMPTGGFSISRGALDTALVGEAVASGVEFLDGVQARLSRETQRERIVQLSGGGGNEEVAAKVVIAADGLRGSLLGNDPDFPRIAAPNSLLGIGATLSAAPAECTAGTIYMAVGDGGYVGQVRSEDGGLVVAGAIARRSLADASTTDGAARRIVEQAGFRWPEELSRVKWQGTPPLTRRLARVAGHRLFVIGDAGAYVEPFTGEGMTWAMLSGCAVVPPANAAVDRNSPEWALRWDALHRQLLGRRMIVCRGISRMLRSPRLTRTAVIVLDKLPWLAAPLIRSMTVPRTGWIGRHTAAIQVASNL
jgi:flavin-dependent dehydrogenase